MINYLYINSSSLGKLAISTFVFIQLAQERLEVLSQGDLKDSLCLSSGRRKSKVTAVVDKTNHLRFSLEVLGYKGADMASASQAIQSAVYDSIYNMFEISKVRIDVSISGIVSKD